MIGPTSPLALSVDAPSDLDHLLDDAVVSDARIGRQSLPDDLQGCREADASLGAEPFPSLSCLFSKFDLNRASRPIPRLPAPLHAAGAYRNGVHQRVNNISILRHDASWLSHPWRMVVVR